MGLDMYLSAKKYLFNFNPEQKQTAELIAKIIGTDQRIKEVTAEAAYWRKANHVHSWFVENIQDGSDDCREYWVSREQLGELIQECKNAINNKDSAKDILPTREGFFFGSTDYDEYYWQDIDETIKKLEAALKNFADGWDFYYQSSW